MSICILVIFGRLFHWTEGLATSLTNRPCTEHNFSISFTVHQLYPDLCLKTAQCLVVVGQSIGAGGWVLRLTFRWHISCSCRQPLLLTGYYGKWSPRPQGHYRRPVSTRLRWQNRGLGPNVPRPGALKFSGDYTESHSHHLPSPCTSPWNMTACHTADSTHFPAQPIATCPAWYTRNLGGGFCL